MNSEKYIGLDVHQATISVAVMDGRGKVVMESILETKAATILEFLAGLRGSLSVTFEEGTWAAWLHVTNDRGLRCRRCQVGDRTLSTATSPHNRHFFSASDGKTHHQVLRPVTTETCLMVIVSLT